MQHHPALGHSLDMHHDADACAHFLPPCFPPDRFASLRPLPDPLSAAASSVGHSRYVRGTSVTTALQARQATKQCRKLSKCGFRQRTLC